MSSKNENNENDFSSTERDIRAKTFFNKYHCIEKLGSGSFGQIYKAEYNNQFYALKIEDRDNTHNSLKNEAEVLNYLKVPQIPTIVSYGYSGKYNILIMQLLDKSLEDLLTIYKKFSIKTICMLACQMITILENIHTKHIIHRDIKPDNFVMGKDENSKFVYLLDFGLAKKFRSSKTLIQLKLINKKRLTGTARYASINASKGYEQSRRDDLEGLSYVLLYLARGNLPWQGMPGKNKEERYKKILLKKIETTSSELCEGFPQEFEKFCEYCKNLKYEEEPNYKMMKQYFLDVLKKEKLKYDYIYEWSNMGEENQIRIYNQDDENRENNSNPSNFENNNNNEENNENQKEKVGCGCLIY